MPFVDAYLTPVRADRKAAYLDLSARMAALYREHGALRVVDCWGSEAHEPQGGFHAEGARGALDDDAPDLRRAAGAEEGEVAVLSWVEWPDRAARDAGMALALADPRAQPRPGEAPIFEGRRVIGGGFEVVPDA